MPTTGSKSTAVRPQPAHAFKIIQSPVGLLKLVAGDRGLNAVLWEDDNPRRVRLDAGRLNDFHPVLVETERQLGEYFAGARETFAVELDFVGTEFQKRVWQALLAIPFGQTRTYGQIARQIGRSAAVRAVGAANGRNPISIICPCHRVIGASGKLTGFAGGLAVKDFLLNLESGTSSFRNGRSTLFPIFERDLSGSVSAQAAVL